MWNKIRCCSKQTVKVWALLNLLPSPCRTAASNNTDTRIQCNLVYWVGEKLSFHCYLLEHIGLVSVKCEVVSADLADSGALRGPAVQPASGSVRPLLVFAILISAASGDVVP